MIRDVVHKVHTIGKYLDTHTLTHVYNDVHQLHPALYTRASGTHRFTSYVTFYSIFSCRDFTGKCTHVHLPNRECSDASYSEALTPCHVLLLMAFMIVIFWYALVLTKGVVA